MELDHVILPLDDSELSHRALGPATAVARAGGADLLLYSVVDDGDAATERGHELEELASTIQGAPVQVRVDQENPPAAGIEQLARTHANSLVCMSTHGRGGVGKSLLGSVAEDVLARLTEPTLLVGPHADTTAAPTEGEVVVCVDGSRLSETMIDHAAEWAAAFDQPLCLLQVLAEDWAAEVASAGVNPGDVNEDSYVADLAFRLRHRSDLSPEWEVAFARDQKHPAAAIVRTLGDRDAALVTMTTHGRSGLRRLIVGSVTMRVVHDAPCPVLVSRPAPLDE